MGLGLVAKKILESAVVENEMQNEMEARALQGLFRDS